MDIGGKILALYEKDTSLAYKNLQELEALSDEKDTLYPYLEEFIAMLQSDKYVMRVRGFRLLCKQARWDKDGKINAVIGDILAAVNDIKPTAVRQALKALEDVVPYKRELNHAIKAMALAIDIGSFKDTMQPLILKDVQRLVKLIDEEPPV